MLKPLGYFQADYFGAYYFGNIGQPLEQVLTGQFCLEAGQVFIAGAKNASVFVAGVEGAKVYASGTVTESIVVCGTQ